MLKYLGKLLSQFDLALRKFFDANSQAGHGWQSQTQAVSGNFGSNPNRTQRYGSAHPAQLKKYTADEVKRYLRGLEQGERARPVMAEAACFSLILNDNMRRHFRGRERIFERLPYVLYQYTQGKPSQEIARSVSYFSDACDVEDAMYFASCLIATKVNRAR